jgi:hypothetical protein
VVDYAIRFVEQSKGKIKSPSSGDKEEEDNKQSKDHDYNEDTEE